MNLREKLASFLPICPICGDTKHVEDTGTVLTCYPGKCVLICTECGISWHMLLEVVGKL